MNSISNTNEIMFPDKMLVSLQNKYGIFPWILGEKYL